MWQYERKLILLEKEFDNARQVLKRLQKDLAVSQGVSLEHHNGDSGEEDGGGSGRLKISMQGIKLQLDLAVGMIRLIKEQAGFYLKLGEKFDLVSFVDDLIEEFSNVDLEQTRSVLRVIDKRWSTEFEKALTS